MHNANPLGVNAKINQFKGDILEYIVKSEYERAGWTVIKISQANFVEGEYFMEFSNYLKDANGKIESITKTTQLTKELSKLSAKDKISIRKQTQKMDSHINSIQEIMEKRVGVSWYDTQLYEEISKNQSGINTLQTILGPFSDKIVNPPVELREELKDGKIIKILFEHGLSGLPDFLCMKNGSVLFIEVKANTDRIKYSQINAMQLLRQNGYAVKVCGVLAQLPDNYKPLKEANITELDIDWEKVDSVDKELLIKKGKDEFNIKDFIKEGKKSNLSDYSK
ncbi:MAG: VRR-NUC domain-containing protein [archaeon]|jgi:hypothetical protein